MGYIGRGILVWLLVVTIVNNSNGEVPNPSINRPWQIPKVSLPKLEAPIKNALPMAKPQSPPAAVLPSMGSITKPVLKPLRALQQTENNPKNHIKLPEPLVKPQVKEPQNRNDPFHQVHGNILPEETETLIHKPADIYVKQEPTHVIINHPDLIIHPAPIIFHKPAAVVTVPRKHSKTATIIDAKPLKQIKPKHSPESAHEAVIKVAAERHHEQGNANQPPISVKLNNWNSNNSPKPLIMPRIKDMPVPQFSHNAARLEHQPILHDKLLNHRMTLQADPIPPLRIPSHPEQAITPPRAAHTNPFTQDLNPPNILNLKNHRLPLIRHFKSDGYNPFKALTYPRYFEDEHTNEEIYADEDEVIDKRHKKIMDGRRQLIKNSSRNRILEERRMDEDDDVEGDILDFEENDENEYMIDERRLSTDKLRVEEIYDDVRDCRHPHLRYK